MKKDKKVPISFEEFTKLLKWYEYTLRIEKTIKAPIEKSIEMEYYLISSTWIENFKNKLSYPSFKEQFIKFKKENNAMDRALNNNEINYLYNQIQVYIPFISYTDKEEIKRINNNKNIVQTDLATNQKYNINYYYNNFVILDRNIFEDIKRGYFIDECPKKSLYLGGQIFVMKLNFNEIEVGTFQTIYTYKEIILLKYIDEQETNQELEKIKTYGIYDYLSRYKIGKNNIITQIIPNNGKEILLINLKNNNVGKIDNRNYNIKNNIGLDISHKRGLKNINNNNSRTNSLIQLLTSIKEIKDYLFNNKNKENFLEFSQIYVLTSTLMNVITELYDKKKEKQPYNLSKLKTVINFINPEINSTSLKSINEYFLFLMDTLHEELKEKKGKDEDHLGLIKYDKKSDTKEKALKHFLDEYNQYYDSIISRTFNWIRQTKIECAECSNNSVYSFQSLPFLEFNLDEIQEYVISHQTEYKHIISKYQNDNKLLAQKISEYRNKKMLQSISLYNCFDFYSKNNYNYKNDKTYCNYCKKQTRFVINYFIYNSPNYFFIILTRVQNINLDYPEEINLETFVEEEKANKKYKLFGTLVNSKINNYEKHYYSTIKNIDQNWIKFDDEKVCNINLKEAHNPINSRVIVYKSVKD
jgi:hypothetical protein